MLVKGEVRCLHCGFDSGAWVGTSGAPLTYAGLQGTSAAPPADASATIRCARCEGSVFLDNATHVANARRLRRIYRLRRQLAAFDNDGTGRAA